MAGGEFVPHVILGFVALVGVIIDDSDGAGRQIVPEPLHHGLFRWRIVQINTEIGDLPLAQYVQGLGQKAFDELNVFIILHLVRNEIETIGIIAIIHEFADALFMSGHAGNGGDARIGVEQIEVAIQLLKIEKLDHGPRKNRRVHAAFDIIALEAFRLHGGPGANMRAPSEVCGDPRRFLPLELIVCAPLIGGVECRILEELKISVLHGKIVALVLITESFSVEQLLQKFHTCLHLDASAVR